MMESILLARADARFDALQRGKSFGMAIDKKQSSKEVPEYIDALIRKLAEIHSQKAIADILNERAIRRPNGQLWQQFHLCRYMQANGIKAVHKWKGRRNITHDDL